MTPMLVVLLSKHRRWKRLLPDGFGRRSPHTSGTESSAKVKTRFDVLMLSASPAGGSLGTRSVTRLAGARSSSSTVDVRGSIANPVTEIAYATLFDLGRAKLQPPTVAKRPRRSSIRSSRVALRVRFGPHRGFFPAEPVFAWRLGHRGRVPSRARLPERPSGRWRRRRAEPSRAFIHGWLFLRFAAPPPAPAFLQAVRHGRRRHIGASHALRGTCISASRMTLLIESHAVRPAGKHQSSALSRRVAAARIAHDPLRSCGEEAGRGWWI